MASSDLFGVPDEYNTFAHCNGNFKVVQSIRLFMMLTSLGIWLTLGFIMVKETIYQLHFWIFSIWLYAISSVAISSGRKKVELVMLDKLKLE